MAENDKVWQARPELKYRKLVDGGMLFDREGQQVHHFNETAAFVWELCQDGQTTAQIVERLRGAYALDDEQVEGDVEDILEEFSDSDLLQ